MRMSPKILNKHQETSDSLTQHASTIEAIDIYVYIVMRIHCTIFTEFRVISALQVVIYEYIDHFGVPSRFDSYIRISIYMAVV